MTSYKSTQALVIKKRLSKDQDIQVTLLSPELGKITALAKGAQSIKSSRLSSLQLGNHIKVSLYQKGDRYWISEAKTITPFLKSEKKLTQLNLLFYFLEIINRFIAEEQVIPEIFTISKNLIDSINQNNFKEFIHGEIILLETLGFGTSKEIENSYQQKDFKLCQKHLKNHLESIMEKPLQSSKLFR